MSIIKHLFLVLLLASAVACGGGGGGSSFSGDYIFKTNLEWDGCRLNVGIYREVLIRVDQDGDRIVVTNLVSGAVLEGTTVGNGWIASSNESEEGCISSVQMAYNGDDKGSLTASVNCSGGGSCVTEYSAIVDRL